MDPILGQILRQAVSERLDLLDRLAVHADRASIESVARTELPRLTDGWRALLAEHEADANGNCRGCSSTWRRHRAPCSVWRTAHEHLVTAGTGAMPATAPEATAMQSTTQPTAPPTAPGPAAPLAASAG